MTMYSAITCLNLAISYISFQVTGTAKKFVYNHMVKQECMKIIVHHVNRFLILLDERSFAHIQTFPIVWLASSYVQKQYFQCNILLLFDCAYKGLLRPAAHEITNCIVFVYKCSQSSVMFFQSLYFIINIYGSIQSGVATPFSR